MDDELMQIEFDETPDVGGMGRVKFNGRFYGLPADAIRVIRTALERSDAGRVRTEAVEEALRALVRLQDEPSRQVPQGELAVIEGEWRAAWEAARRALSGEATTPPLAQAVIEWFGDEPDSTLKPGEKRLRDMAKEMAQQKGKG